MLPVRADVGLDRDWSQHLRQSLASGEPVASWWNYLLQRLLPVRADEGLDMQGLEPALEAVSGSWRTSCWLVELSVDENDAGLNTT